MAQQQFDDLKMTPSTCERQRCVVIVCCLTVDVRPLRDEKLHRAQMSSTACFHQRCSAPFRFMFLYKPNKQKHTYYLLKIKNILNMRRITSLATFMLFSFFRFFNFIHMPPQNQQIFSSDSILKTIY